MRRAAVCVLIGGLVQPGLFAQQAAPGAAPASGSQTASEGQAPLTFRASVMEAYDDNLIADTTVGTPSTGVGLFTGAYSAADAELTFRHKAGRVSFDGQAGSAIRYYPVGLDLTTATHQASGRLQTTLGPSSRLTVSQAVRYAPQQALSVLGPDAAIEPAASAFDVALTSVGRLQANTGVDLDLDLTRETSATVSSGFSHQQLIAGQSLRRYDAGGRLAHNVTRKVKLAGAYSHQVNVSATATGSRVHDATVTASYEKPLSQTRHMQFEAGAGTSVLDQQGRLQYRATGHARLRRDVTRTWSAGGSFARQYVYFDWLALPVFANRFSADVSGHMGRRVETKLEASYAGSQETPSSANAFNVYVASGTVIYALTPRFGLYGGYTRFYYDFLNGAGVAAASSPAVGRNSVRGGLTMLMPIVRGSRERKQP